MAKARPKENVSFQVSRIYQMIWLKDSLFGSLVDQIILETFISSSLTCMR